MLPSVEPASVSHGIQLAVAPVFLLTAVAAMIGAVAARLARIIDRARALEERITTAGPDDTCASAWRELADLRKRGLLANGCIGLQTLCAFLIGITIIVLFLGETTELQVIRVAMGTFLSGVICFLLALVCFLAETIIATRLLNFGQKRR